MHKFADLELTLNRVDNNRYSIEMRFTQPNSEADIQLVRGDQAFASFDMAALREQEVDPQSYGQLLGEMLFNSADAKQGFGQARSTALALEVPLRMRLTISPTAPELHALRWETLRNPDDGEPLLTSQNLFFSRYLSSGDWRPVKLRPRGPLRALVIVANPANLTSYQPGGRALDPVDVAAEVERAKVGLSGIWIDVLASGGSATLEAIDEKLRASNRIGQPYDVIYIAAHGALIKGEPRIWLENSSGNAAVTPGTELVNRLRELSQSPRLIVFVSCQSSGTGRIANTGDGGAITALGPRLAEAGVPAVIAMQGNVSMRTMGIFIPAFFAALLEDGQIDRAVTVARSAVRYEPDSWMPVLFMRLRRGSIWYVPGFAGDFEKWPALVRSIRRAQCTPVIGPRVSEMLLGSPQETARTWAETYNFPLEPHAREQLPQVAQYLSVNQDARFPHEELIEYMRRDLLRRYGSDLEGVSEQSALHELFAALGKLRRQNEADAFRVLAELPFPLYITTNFSNLLAEALRAAGRDPQVELCRWNADIEALPSIYDHEPDYRPTPERPLVYHLFGMSQHPESIVLTEDDYFDYLIGITGNRDLVPAVVRRALADTALLFLGFHMNDWHFRVLFRSIVRQQGGERRRRYAHVAAQIEPEEGRVLEPERARRYFESYFQGDDISIFWGSVDDFIKELLARWRDTPEESRAVGGR